MFQHLHTLCVAFCAPHKLVHIAPQLGAQPIVPIHRSVFAYYMLGSRHSLVHQISVCLIPVRSRQPMQQARERRQVLAPTSYIRQRTPSRSPPPQSISTGLCAARRALSPQVCPHLIKRHNRRADAAQTTTSVTLETTLESASDALAPAHLFCPICLLWVCLRLLRERLQTGSCPTCTSSLSAFSAHR